MILRLLFLLALILPLSCGSESDYQGWLIQTASATPVSKTATFGGTDSDRDGFATALDCDDTNFQIVPGYSYPCDAGTGANSGHRVCNTNGSYGSCIANVTTPLCEKTAGVGAACYYINHFTGSDTTGDGSYSNPWASLRCISKFYSSAPGCNVDPAPGSVVYLLGTGTYTTTFNNNSGNAGETNLTLFLDSSRSGTAGHPLTIRGYPGSDVDFSVAGSSGSIKSMIYLLNVDYLTLDNLKKTTSTGYGSLIHAPNDASDDLIITRSDFRNQDGDGNQNLSALNQAQGLRTIFKWNYVLDIADSLAVGNVANVSAIVIFNDNTGGGHEVAYNRMGYSALATSGGNIRGKGAKFKHGAAYNAAALNLVHHNIIFNFYGAGISLNTAGMRVYGNLIIGGESTYAACIEQFEDAPLFAENGQYYNNTCVGAHLFVFSGQGTAASYANGAGPFSVNNNIAVGAFGFAGDTFGVGIDQYGNDAQYAYMYPDRLTIAANCLYDTVASGYKVGIFGFNGTIGHGPSGPAGTTSTTIGACQALGLCAGDVWANANLDSNYAPGNSSCANMGWSATAILPASITRASGGKAGSKGRGK